MIKEIILPLLFFPLITYSQNLSISDSLKIINVLETQKIAWNNNDIDEFMNGYFNSEKLVFSGQSGPVYGWKSTKERYLTKYNSKELMGNLKFDIEKMRAELNTILKKRNLILWVLKILELSL